MLVCNRTRSLPILGGVMDQPWGFMVRMLALVSYEKAYEIHEQLGDKAPNPVRSRVLATAARSILKEN